MFQLFKKTSTRFHKRTGGFLNGYLTLSNVLKNQGCIYKKTGHLLGFE
jgi:hypothetical protein